MMKHHNRSSHKYVSEDKTVKRTYLLDVNPWAWERERGDGQNIIDARWIDTRNGLYIDITGLSETHPDVQPGVWVCKNYHRYEYTEKALVVEEFHEYESHIFVLSLADLTTVINGIGISRNGSIKRRKVIRKMKNMDDELLDRICHSVLAVEPTLLLQRDFLPFKNARFLDVLHIQRPQH